VRRDDQCEMTRRSLVAGILLTAALAGVGAAGIAVNADHPEAAVVACLQPSLDSGELKQVVVDRVERHYRLIVVPIDGDTAEVTLLVTHQLGPPFAFSYLLSWENGRWSSPCGLRR